MSNEHDKDLEDIASMKAELKERADLITDRGVITSVEEPVFLHATPDPDQADEEDEVEADATDAAEALAEEHGIDLAEITGTGANGRILLADVQAAVAAKEEE